MSRLVSVVVPIPKNQAFDYIVPDALEGKVRVGSALVVPFGARKMTGYVVGFSDEAAALAEARERGEPRQARALKRVERVLDIPPLSDELIKLGRWIAEYYMSSLGEALHAMVPGPAARGPARLLSLSAAGKDRANWEAAGEKGRAILEELAQGGSVSATALRRRFSESGAIDYWLRRLSVAGLVEVTFRAGASDAPVNEVVSLRAGRDELQAWLAGAGRRAPARARIVEAVAAASAPVLYEELRRSAGATRTLVTYLESIGLITVERKPVEQDLGDFIVDDTITEIEWTDEQRVALDRIVAHQSSGRFGVILLHGATGSGKTFLYMEAARQAVAAGRTALVLVPEISLTPQTVHRFRVAFGERVAVVHSMLPPAERIGVWHQIARGEKDVVIGPRSAVFAPVANLGLVVVDEEHEGAYKQEESPRYHGRDVAIYRAHLAGATVLLGSATPSLESTRNAQLGRYDRIVLARGRELPPVERVDLRASPPGPARFLSPELLARIAETTAAGGQTILLLNRRGYAVFLLCESCGYVPRCPHCSVTFTYHLRGHALRCHYCARSERAPAQCPLCSASAFRYRGTGTQRVEEELIGAAPGLRVARMDYDSTRRRGAHGEILRAFARGEIDCLVGTQMIAKGLDFPRVRLVGVVSADTALHLPDFRAAERTFSLLVQVAGRAGRGEGKGLVIVQSWTPEHPAIALASRYDIDTFVAGEMAEREALRFPPFSSLIALTFAGRDGDAVDAASIAAAERLSKHPRFREAFFELLGPSPAAIAKVRDHFRWQILLKARRESWRLGREILATTLEAGAAGRSKVDTTIDIDAQSLL